MFNGKIHYFYSHFHRGFDLAAPHRRVVAWGTLGANSIDLVDEDDAGGVFPGLPGSRGQGRA